jgi:hypothetical protein
MQEYLVVLDKHTDFKKILKKLYIIWTVHLKNSLKTLIFLFREAKFIMISKDLK